MAKEREIILTATALKGVSPDGLFLLTHMAMIAGLHNRVQARQKDLAAKLGWSRRKVIRVTNELQAQGKITNISPGLWRLSVKTGTCDKNDPFPYIINKQPQSLYSDLEFLRQGDKPDTLSLQVLDKAVEIGDKVLQREGVKFGTLSAQLCVKQGEKVMPIHDWKRQLQPIAQDAMDKADRLAAVKAQKRADRAKATRVGNQIDDAMNTSRPIEKWNDGDFAKYFHRRYYETYPDAQLMTILQLVENKKGLSLLRKLAKELQPNDLELEDAIPEGKRRLKKLIHHTFLHVARFLDAFNITDSNMTVGIMWGFRRKLILDMDKIATVESKSGRIGDDLAASPVAETDTFRSTAKIRKRE